MDLPSMNQSNFLLYQQHSPSFNTRAEALNELKKLSKSQQDNFQILTSLEKQ